MQISTPSQKSGFPRAHGTKVKPSGRFPSDRDRPFGYFVVGLPVVVKAQVILFFIISVAKFNKRISDVINRPSIENHPELMNLFSNTNQYVITKEQHFCDLFPRKCLFDDLFTQSNITNDFSGLYADHCVH